MALTAYANMGLNSFSQYHEEPLPAHISLRVLPLNGTLSIGMTQQFFADTLLVEGRMMDITHHPAVRWSSSDPAIASVSNDGANKGQVTGVASGTVTITASGWFTNHDEPFSASVTLSVTAADVVSLHIMPALAVVPLGLPEKFAVIARLSDGRHLDVTDQAASLSWHSSEPAIAPIDDKGLVKTMASGSSRISVSGQFSGRELSTTTEMTVVEHDALFIKISPETRPLMMPAGHQQQLMATAYMSDGTTYDLTDHMNWFSDDPLIASIGDRHGDKGLITANRNNLAGNQIASTWIGASLPYKSSELYNQIQVYVTD